MSGVSDLERISEPPLNGILRTLSLGELRRIRLLNRSLRERVAPVLQERIRQYEHDMELVEILTLIGPYYHFDTGFEIEPLEEQIEEEDSESEQEDDSSSSEFDEVEHVNPNRVKRKLDEMGILTPDYGFDSGLIEFVITEPFQYFTSVKIESFEPLRFAPDRDWYERKRDVEDTVFPFALSSVSDIHITDPYHSVRVTRPTIELILLSMRSFVEDSAAGPDGFKIDSVRGTTISLSARVELDTDR